MLNNAKNKKKIQRYSVVQQATNIFSTLLACCTFENSFRVLYVRICVFMGDQDVQNSKSKKKKPINARFYHIQCALWQNGRFKTDAMQNVVAADNMHNWTLLV